MICVFFAKGGPSPWGNWICSCSGSDVCRKAPSRGLWPCLATLTVNHSGMDLNKAASVSSIKYNSPCLSYPFLLLGLHLWYRKIFLTRSSYGYDFLRVCNARRATNLVMEVCDGGPCYAGQYNGKHFLTSSIRSTT